MICANDVIGVNTVRQSTGLEGMMSSSLCIQMPIHSSIWTWVCVCVRTLRIVFVYVFVCPCQCMLFPLSPLAVCVCHYPAGAALMEAVISNAVN